MRWFGISLQVAFVSLTCHAAAAVAEPQDSGRIAIIDTYALATPSSAETSATSLVSYLSQPARDDTEKARAIFRWVADRISYDVDAYFSNQLVKMSADDVLRQRRGICDGYATLFEKLAREAGMEVVTIKGYAKAYGYIPGSRFDRPNHAWNAIKINGQWRLIDATWGAGYIKNGKYVKVLAETFFLASPEQFMFSHLPVDDAWQLQATPRVSKAEFESMPTLEPAFFHLGISGENVWREMKNPGLSGNFVRTYDIPYHQAIVQQAPLSYRLVTDQPIRFAIHSDAFEEMAIVQNDKWTPIPKAGALFAMNIVPHNSGELMVVGKTADATNYTTLLGYVVKP
jgi:hypothetical protein